MKAHTRATFVDKVDRQQIDYSGHAPTYEEQRFHGRRNEYLEALRRSAVLKAIGAVQREARVLDVGCGAGRGLLHLAAIGFTDIIGLDYTPAMLDLARKHIEEQELETSIVLKQGDAFALPFDDGTFDLVTSHNFLHMFRFDLQQKLITEMTRVCTPGGRVVAEFENIHKGLFVTRYIEQRRLRRRTKFNSVREICKLFPPASFHRVQVFGTAFPLLYRLFCHSPRIGRAIESITHLRPFNWMAERIVVAAQLHP